MAGQIINRGERKWTVRVFLGRDGDGKRTYQNRSIHGNKRDAEKALAEMLKTRSLGPSIIDIDRVLVSELLDDLERDYKLNGKDVKWCGEKVRLHLKPFFGSMRAARVTSATIAEFCAMRLENEAAVATVNRELSLLKRAYNLGLQCSPPKVHQAPRIKLFREDNARKGFFEHPEFLAMREALPDYLKGVVTFGYLTGCRKGEILTMEWSQIDFTAGVARMEVGETKNKEAREVPLFGELPAILKMQKEATEAKFPRCPWVFHLEGERLQSFWKAWRTASKAAGLIDREGEPTRIFHDFRRTAVRNMVRAGIPEQVAMRISGHKSRTVFERYNVTNAADIRLAAARLSDYMGMLQTKADEAAAEAVAENRHTIGTQEASALVH